MTITKELIHSLAEKYFQEVVSIRRYIHQNPELSFYEEKTSEYIINVLSNLNIPFKTGFAKYGIIAEIAGAQELATTKKIIALRADIDALPIEEKNNISYKSNNNHIMHACGHDAHTASLLGTAMILNELREHFAGKIKLIFQPAEERIPGGAKEMLEQGVLLPDGADIVLAQHVFPNLETGFVGFRSGKYMASTDEIYISLKGKGGHAAMPHEINDIVVVASTIIVSLQQLVSRLSAPQIPTVLSFGKFIADGSTNIIPDEVKIEGTFRTMNENWRNNAKLKMKEIAVSIAQSFGVECFFEIKDGYPALINDESVTQNAMKFSGEYLGNEKVKELDIRMTAEDFSYFAQKYPSCLYRLGTGNAAKGINSPLHSANFNIDEDSLKTGIGLMSWLAIKFLET